MIGYFYIGGTLLFTIYGQMIIKWRLSEISFQLPDGIFNKLMSLVKIIFDPYIFSGFASAFISSLFWMAAMSKFEITRAYPFMSLAPALVFLLGVGLLGEEFTWGKLFGLIFILLGVYLTVKL